MRTGTKLRSNLYVLVMPLLVAACAFGAAMILAERLVSRERLQVLARTDAEGKHVVAQLRSAVLQSMDVLPRIGNWWLSQGRPDAREDWEADAQLFLKSGTGLRELDWINPAGKTLWSVRPGAAPDFRHRATDTEIAETFGQTRQNGSIRLSKVFNRNGKPHFYACVPIRNGPIVGYVAGLFDATAMAGALLGDEAPNDYQISIAVDGFPVTAPGKAEWPVWRGGTRSAELQAGDRRWSVRLVPAATDIQTLQRGVWIFGGIVSILLYAFTALALRYKRNESALALANSALEAGIAERKRAEETIRQQVADFQALVEVLPVGLAVSNDADCREIWMNRQLAAMLHLPVDTNISRSSPDGDQLPYQHMRNGKAVAVQDLPMQVAAASGKAVFDVELDVVRKDGSVLHTLNYAAPVMDPSGTVRRVINVCVDMTEYKSLEERLLRAEKYRSLVQMAGGVAHDFNNLLTTILGYAEIANAEIAPESVAGHAISQILPATNRAAELAGQLLSYTGRGWLELTPLDLSQQIQGLSESLRAMAPGQVDVSFALAADLPPIRAGVREVEHVLRNLVANALDAIGEGCGTVKIRTDTCYLSARELARDYPDQELGPGRYVRLEIRDSGAGVPSQFAARVFEPFFTTKFMGRGLGLSEVQGIMRSHGGGVRLDTSEGRGTSVLAVFPVEPGSRVRETVTDRCA